MMGGKKEGQDEGGRSSIQGVPLMVSTRMDLADDKKEEKARKWNAPKEMEERYVAPRE
jgi:hypothetical protein